MQVNIEARQKVFVVCDLMCPLKYLNVWREIQKSIKSFSISIQKVVTNIDKDGNESVVTKSYKLKFIDSARFMAISLLNLVDILTKETHTLR